MSYKKFSWKWVKDLKVRTKTTKLSGEILSDVGVGTHFLDRIVKQRQQNKK